MGSLKSPCGTSYRSSIETIALNCLIFEEKKCVFVYTHFDDRQTDGQTDEQMGRTNAHCREQRLSKYSLPLQSSLC